MKIRRNKFSAMLAFLLAVTIFLLPVQPLAWADSELARGDPKNRTETLERAEISTRKEQPAQTKATRNGEASAQAAIEKSGTVTYYDSFVAAADSTNWTAGSTLKLMADVTTSSTITVSSGKRTLNLNGHTITRTGGTGDNNGIAIMVKDAGDLTVTGPGKVTGGYGWHGGGVHVANNCSAVLDNCEISGNAGHYGGGLYSGGGTITLKNGTVIKNNSASDGFGGSGIYAENRGTLILEKATFTGNEIRDNGKYAVFLCGNAKLQVSGAPVIYNNTYNGTQKNLYLYQSADQDSKVQLIGSLSAGAHIGVGQANGAGVISSGWSTCMGSADPANYFTSDNSSYQVYLSGSGEAAIGTPPVAFVISGGTTTECSTFSDAVNAWTAGSTLKLMADVTTSSTVSVSSGEHTLDLNGHGIKMTGWGSVFYVGGGAKLIIDDSDTKTTHKFDVPNGAGLASLNEAGGNYTVNGGYITGGNAENGGGIYIGEYGEVVMNGGTLIGSHADDMGAGVRIESNTSFTLNGGEIAYNQSSCHGGGICAAYTNHTVITVNGGAIHHNLCQYSSGAITLDGDPDSYLYLYGGEIRDNASVSESGNNPWHPGGIAGNGNIHVKGGAQVYNNINLSSSNNGTARHNIEIAASENDLITLDGPLSQGARIAVSYHTGGNKTTGVFTSGWSKYMGDADPADYFASDYDEYIVSLNNGEAEIAPPPVAGVTNGESTANYSSISDAVSAWTAGSTLKLLADVSTSSTVNVPSGEHTLDLNGHGIKMTGSGSVISLSSGANLRINDSNPEAEHRFTVSNAQSNGAGLATVNDSLTSGYKTFKGGYITGGSAQQGGGILVGTGAYLTLNAGTIIGNKSSFFGAGIKVSNNGDNDGKCFTMNGGSIIYNSVSGYGGGLNSDAGVTMTGGTIAYNYATKNPGGIHCHYLYLSGGRIENNYAGASDYVAGVHADHEVFISGNPVISGNLYNGSASNLDWDRTELNHGHKINITGALSEGAKIGVTMRIGGTGVITSGWSTYMGSADPASYFTSDNSSYQVYLSGSGEAAIGTPPAASVISGGTATDYAAFSDAVNAWTAGSTLKLMADVTTSGTVSVPSGKHTLDLNGHELKAGSTGYSVVTVGSGAELVIDDTSENTGKITGGSVGQNSGGGVTVDGGTLTLKGGAISGNANTYGGIGNSGGGVHVRNSGKFYMEGGEISGNTSYVGGGVCADSSATTVSITGGVIKNNVTERFGSAIWAGRNSSAIFRIGGTAQIIDNISKWTSDKDGEGTLNTGSTYLLSGDPTVHGDWKTNGTSSPNTHINLDNDGSGIQRIELEGALTNSTGTPKLTVTPLYRWNDLKNGQTFVFTKNWSSYMGTAHPADYFKVDDSVSGVRVIRKDGEAAVTGGSDLGDLYITFDANGGSGTMEPQLTTSTSAALNQNAFTRRDYEFTGWNTKQDGSGTGYADKASVTLTGDLTLYAQWKEEPSPFEGKGTDEQPYLIQSANDWDTLSSYINSGGTRYAGKSFQLTNDISVTTVLGNRPNTGTDSNDNVFSGTFDGGGHTLTVSINDSVFAAPFAIAHNATIKNLNVTGTVTSTGNHATGLVGASKGRSINDASTLVIQNVTVSVSVSCNSHVAGIVGHAHKASITMENVVFDGSLNASSVQGGFIGWGGITGGKGFSASFKDCLFAGSYRSGAAFYPVAFASGQGTATLVNDFYTTSLGSGGSPIATTGDGQVRLLAVTVEKDGKVRYFDNIGTAAASENWVAGSTLRLMADVSNSVTITVPAGEHTLDLNGYTLTQLSTVGKLLVGGGASSVSGLTIIDQTGNGVIKHEVSRPGSLIWVKEGSSLTLNGGTLEANSSASPVIDFFQQKNASFTMNGGKITGIANNGAVRLSTNCSFTMTGGEISGLQTGSGLIDYSADAGSVIKLSGNPVITNNTANGQTVNLNVPDGKTLTISGALTGGASVGITTQSIPGGFTSGWSTYMDSADPSQYFTSDNADCEIAAVDGEACVQYPALPGVSAEDYTGDYDGNAHGISVSAPDGATVRYGTEEGSYTLSENPTYTDAGTYTVYYEVSKDLYRSAYGSADVTINKINATVTITGATAAADYDGEAHVAEGYEAVADSDLYDVSRDIAFDGEAKAVRTDAGTTEMGLTAEQFRNTNDNFETVTFAVTDGYVKINPINVTVTITGRNDTVDYDGKAHSVSGYDVEIENPLYSEADFTFSGEAKATATDAGTAYMGLDASQFENHNSNFAEVTFDVTDGYIKVKPIDVTVAIIGHRAIYDYDGMAHSVSGYDVQIENPLYSEADFTFSGTARAERTEAGIEKMGLKAEQFENTNGNFSNVTFEITDGYLQIGPIDVTVTITGHTDAVDYDGKAHSVTGYDVEIDNPLYSEADFTFSGTAAAEQTDAGTCYMGLDASQFTNTNGNFATVVFDVTDGCIRVDPIEATVVITGHSDTVDYDGSAHTVSGFDAEASTALYDVENDFTFTGTDTVSQTDAGTAKMGLRDDMFVNTNGNFKYVDFRITDGYLTVEKVNALVTKAPARRDLVFSGSEQELITAGTAEGGTLYYALGNNSTSIPADSGFSTSLPVGRNVGNYYVWYEVIADSNHVSLPPVCIKITVAEKGWTTVAGIIQDAGNNPVNGATVSLTAGGKIVDTIVSGSDGSYYFTAPAGVYNIVVNADGATVTDMVNTAASMTYNVSIADANTDSVLNVVGSGRIVVGGLNSEAEAVRARENISSATNVAVRMTVTPVAAAATGTVSAIADYAADMNFEYYDFKVVKTVGSVTSNLEKTQTVLEIVIPCSFTNKQEVSVYCASGAGIQTLTESNSRRAGTFRVDVNAGLVYIYTNQIMTYAIGYKPYFSVTSELSLGSFTGSVSVKLTKDDGTVYELNDVSSDNVSFKGIPKGNYTMTITWTDGAENTLTLPFVIK